MLFIIVLVTFICVSFLIDHFPLCFWLLLQLTPKRPLRSEVERERRLSRPTSTLTPTSSVQGLAIGAADTHSLSGESSNRNSISKFHTKIIFFYVIHLIFICLASEDDTVPPPLPAKTRDSNDYSNLADGRESRGSCGGSGAGRNSGKYTNKPLPAIPAYDLVETRNPCVDVKRRPPTPPPKPSRNSKYVQV